MEDRCELGTETVLNDITHVFDLAKRTVHRLLEARVLIRQHVARRVRNAREIDRIIHAEDRPDRHTSRRREASQDDVLLGAWRLRGNALAIRQQKIRFGEPLDHRPTLLDRRRHQCEQLSINDDGSQK